MEAGGIGGEPGLHNKSFFFKIWGGWEFVFKCFGNMDMMAHLRKN